MALSTNRLLAQILRRNVFRKTNLEHIQALGLYHLRNVHSSQRRLDSFAKHQATGKIDMGWVFPYPTVSSEDNLYKLEEFSKTVSEFLKNKPHNAEFNDEAIQGFKDLGLFALNVPTEFGGKGLKRIEYCRVMQEILHTSMHHCLNSHSIQSIQALLSFGSGDQKHEYLPRLAKGDLIGTVALEERWSGSDISDIKSSAYLSKDGKHWLLNGVKHWVVNGNKANFFIAFAKTSVVDVNEEIVEKLTAFLVEKSFGGITINKSETVTALQGANISTLEFTDTKIPVKNVLGEVGFGFQIGVSILNSDRSCFANLIASHLKKNISNIYEIGHNKIRFGSPLSENRVFQSRLFDVTMSLYVIESMLYMNAKHTENVDDNGNQVDCSIENAMVKVLCSKFGLQSLQTCTELIGIDYFDSRFPFSQTFEDLKLTSILKGSDDVLKQYIALGCLKYAAVFMESRIEASRAGGFRERVTAMKDQAIDEYNIFWRGNPIPGPSFGLKGKSQTKTWLEPKLESLGHLIESLTALYKKRVFENLRNRGKFLEEEPIILTTMADIGTNLYALTCVLARCNKSLILGLKGCDHELDITRSFAQRTNRETSILLNELGGNDVYHFSQQRSKVNRQMSAERRYLCAHPLEVVHRLEEHPKYVEARKKILELSN